MGGGGEGGGGELGAGNIYENMRYGYMYSSQKRSAT